MTVAESAKADIISAFGAAETQAEGVVEKLYTLKLIFNVSTDDLFVEWETFNVTIVQDNLDLTVSNLDRFQVYLQSNITTKATPSLKRSRDLNSSAIKRKPMIRNSPLNSSPTSTPNSKKAKHEETKTSIESSPGSYETANNTFQSSPLKKDPLVNRLASQQESNTVIETLNPHIEESAGFTQVDEDASTSIKPFKLASNIDPAKYKFRTMAMKLLESADVLDDQIDSVAQMYQEANESKDIQFGNPCLSSQFDILCSGRIVPDSPTYDKLANFDLNSTSLYLETSRMSGIGQRIPLDLTNLKGYSLFSGQIVILKGRNPTGRSFIVQQVLPLPELGAPVSTKKELQEFEELSDETGLKIVVASGPYSNQHTLDYQRLTKFAQQINSTIRPHVVVLNGPFIDITNNSVSQGEIEADKQSRNLDEVFKKLITPILRSINPRIQIILIPSLKDTSIKHCSYPQDAFDRKKFGLPKNVKIFPNPTSFSINEVLIGNSNLDVFKDLKDVYKDDPTNSTKVLNNRFERIANHIFEQRRFYPSFPGSIRRNVIKSDGNSELHGGIMQEELSDTTVGGSSLEVPYLGLTELGSSLPDILISPSELKFFVKVIKGVVVINPGFFIKPNRDPVREDGSYVVVNIAAPNVSSEDTNVESVSDELGLYYHNVYKRSRVDIFKS